MKKPAAVLLLLALATSAMLATNGTRMIGFSPTSLGRGGASYGVFDSPLLMMTNPAGMSFMKGSSLDVAFSLMVPTLKFSNTLNDADGATNYFPLPGAAYTTTGDKLSWGIGFFTQGGMGADFTLTHALFPDKQTYHSKFAVMQGGPSVAYRLSDDLSIGVSAHLVYGMLEFGMPYSLNPLAMQGSTGMGMTFGQMFAAPPASGGFGYTEVTASAKMSGLTAFGFAGKIGLAYKASADLSLGFSYSSPTALSFTGGTANMDMTAQLDDAFGKAVVGYMAQHPAATAQQAQTAVATNFSAMGIDLSKGVVAKYDLKAKMTLPQSIGAGAAWHVNDRLLLAADLEWVNWKNAFDKMTLTLSNGTSVNINTMMGNAGAFGIDFPMNWEDAICVRLGGEYAVSPTLAVRAGYAYGSNPVPTSTIFPLFPAIVENHVTVGASVGLSTSLTLNLAYELALNQKETADASSIIAQEYNGSTSQLSENIFHASISWAL